MKTALYFLPAIVISVGFLISAKYAEDQKLIYISKPVSTLIVICALLVSFQEPTRNLLYSAGILLGLIFSLGGDIALMFEKSRKAFLAGLLFFLLTHVAYTVVFITLGTFSVEDMPSSLLLVVAGIAVYKLIQHKLKALKKPIIGYIVVISVMVSRANAVMNSFEFGYEQALMIAFGAILFYISDVILALNQFGRPWKYNYILLVFYYSGQFLLALAASYF